MRSNQFLENKLKEIWSKHFSDVPRPNTVHIFFGRKAARRLGSIKKTKRLHHLRDKNSKFDTIITINGHFKNPLIPEFLIDATIAHELCHYAHGFSSPLPQLSKFPHRGGVVDNEMVKRGLERLIQNEERWLDQNWLEYLQYYYKNRY